MLAANSFQNSNRNDVQFRRIWNSVKSIVLIGTNQNNDIDYKKNAEKYCVNYTEE